MTGSPDIRARPVPLNIRHVIAPQGTLPVDPDHQPVSGVAKAVLSVGREQARTGHSVEIWGWNADDPAGSGAGTTSVSGPPRTGLGRDSPAGTSGGSGQSG